MIDQMSTVNVQIDFGNLFPLPNDGNNFCVDARLLHEALEVGRDFSSWIKGRIEKYDFVEGTDFKKSSTISQSPDLRFSPDLGKTSNLSKTPEDIPAGLGDTPEVNLGGRPSVEYSLTLDMAKQLCMVENNERGLLARKYFIACEEQLYKRKSPAKYELTMRERVEFLRLMMADANLGANQRALCTNNLLIKHTGENLLADAHCELVAIEQKQRLTPTALGALLNPPLSAIKVNGLLCEHGFQIGVRRSKKINYEATEKGAPYSELVEESYINGKGTTLTLRWYTSIIPIIQSWLEN